MTAKERVRAAMSGLPTDRVPVFPVVTVYLASRVLRRPVQDFVLDPLLVYQGLRALHRHFGFDGFEVGLGPEREDVTPRVKEIDGCQCLLDRQEKPVARLQADDLPIPLDPAPPLKEKKDLDRMKIVPAAQFLAAGCAEPVARLVKDVGNSAFIAGTAAGQTMNTLVAWRGSEQALTDLMEDPPFVHAVMERATDQSIEVGRALIAGGVDGIYIGDAWASASIISPRLYEEFCLPYHRKAARAFRDLGAKVYLHICGNSYPLLSLMAQTGVDAIEPLDVDGGVPIEKVRSQVGPKLCLKGGVSTLLLLRGSPDEVHAQALRCIELLGPIAYILGGADDIPRDAPFENIEAMVQAARDYRATGTR